jgi:hypothetical protein
MGKILAGTRKRIPRFRGDDGEQAESSMLCTILEDIWKPHFNEYTMKHRKVNLSFDMQALSPTFCAQKQLVFETSLNRGRKL